MNVTVRKYVGVLSLLALAAPAAAAINPSHDYNILLAYTAVRHDSTIDGLVQTFNAQNTRLLEAAITIASPDNAEALWSSPYVEIRRGQPGNITGSDGNVVFRSNPIVWSALPQIGTDNGNPLYAIRLTDLGLTSFVPLQFNQLYSLTLKDEGSGGRLHYVDSAPYGLYSLGGTRTHTRGADPSTWSFQLIADIGFQITLVPEPAMLGSLILLGAIGLGPFRGRARSG